MLECGLYDVPDGTVAEIVTHLQMMERAAPRGLDLPTGVAFRKVAADVAWYRDIFARVGHDWLWHGHLKLSDAALSDILDDPDVDIYTLAQAGQDEALLVLDFRQDDACELAYFGLTDTLIGTGSGGVLMDKAIALAWERPIKRFHVHTCTLDSPQALGFYIRSGFTPYKRQVEINDDPRLTGALPKSAGPHVPVLP